MSSHAARRARALLQIAIGTGLVFIGMAVTWLTYEASFGWTEDAFAAFMALIPYVPLTVGASLLVIGLIGIVPEPQTTPPLAFMSGLGYKSFVAGRYLLILNHRVTLRTKLAVAILVGFRMVLFFGYEIGVRIEDFYYPLEWYALATSTTLLAVLFWGVVRYSKISTIIFIFGIGLGLFNVVIGVLAATNHLPLFDLTPDRARPILQVTNIVALGAFALSFLAAFFGTLRGFFTFFTTVPIGGVWIGTAALVCVLAVMSGFETDLREKILGSNAHIQITREDGEFVDWRTAKAKIDKIPGVVASTPFAVSEVVIAANNNGMNVIIKGIDPATVGKVTDLESDLKDRDALKRLEPLIKDIHDRSVPQVARPTKGVVDPAPDDMVNGSDPIDFSVPDAGVGSDETESGSGSGSAGSGSAHAGSAAARTNAGSGSRPAGDPDIDAETAYGGDATRVIEPKARASDSDPFTSSDIVRWAVGDHDPSLGDPANPAVQVIDVPLEPSLSRRTQALPGILVGQELVKQTHLYTGQEVRVVSPLSDPSNPDATGTPIPFNRDYRVAGIFYTGMYEYDLKYVYVTLDSLQDFLDRGESVDGIEVRITDANDTERYVPTDDNSGLIRDALGPGYRIQDWRELNRSLFSALKLEKIAMFLVLGIVILVASFSIVGNLIMVVVEKGREIALLKTLGASDAGVMQLFAIQGLLIGLIGTILGVSFGLVLCWFMKEIGLPLNPDVYYIDRLPVHIDRESVAASAAAGVFISIAATFYPALMAARVRPATGMRH